MKKEIRNGVILLSLGIITSISILVIKGNNIASVSYSNYLKSENVTYTNNSQSTVQGAIDNLYTKATTWIDPSTYPVKMNTSKTVWASPAGVCIKRNNIGYCFGINNYVIEKDHIQSVFSDVSCSVDLSRVDCRASDFYCYVDSYGDVSCSDRSDYSSCGVYSDGSLGCN